MADRSMTPERWKRLWGIVHQALDLEPGSGREQFLEDACGEDGEIRDRARALIDSDASNTSDQRIEQAVGRAASAVLDAAPRSIGPYRIIRLIGRGGMGAVYEAEQQHPKRRVALKVLRADLVSAETLRRFEREAEAMGRLQHPGIAKIYEAGTTPNDGQPFFAMEVISGDDILSYADRHRLDSRARIGLVGKVCEAVHHAHQRGVVHRDLKPANILVEESGQPKVLDFGVARLAGGDGQTRQTDVGQLIGTMNYMSPEQVLGDPSQIDARCDVYSIGVILFELLTGRLPHDGKGKPLHEAVLAIREEEPVSLVTLDPRYRGDVGVIVGRALERDKSRRYQTANDLADDIHRYLREEPILARPPSASYQLVKFARRNRALVTGALAVLLALVAGVVASTWQAIRATRAEAVAIVERDRAEIAQRSAEAAQRAAQAERDRAVSAERASVAERDRAIAAEIRSDADRQRADLAAATAGAVRDFLQFDLLGQASVIAQANRNSSPKRDLKVREALDRAAANIDAGKFAEQPAVEAAIRHTIGFTYNDLGLYAEAHKQLARALPLRTRMLGKAHRDTLDTMQALAAATRGMGTYPEAVTLYREVAALRASTLGPDHRDTLRSLDGEALSLRGEGKYAEAAAVFGRVLERSRRVLGPEDPDTLSTMVEYSTALTFTERFREALDLARKAYEVRSRVLGADHPDTLLALHSVGVGHYIANESELAAQAFKLALDAQRRVLGADHPDTLNSANILANVYGRMNWLNEAEALYKSVIEARTRVLGETHASTIATRSNLSNVYLAQGRVGEALAIQVRNLELDRKMLGPENPQTMRTIHNLAEIHLHAGNLKEAEELARLAVELRRKVFGSAHRNTINSTFGLANILARLQRHAEAAELYGQTVDYRRRSLGSADPDTFAALDGLARSLLHLGRFAEAESATRESLAGREKRAKKDWQYFHTRYLLSLAMALQAKPVDLGRSAEELQSQTAAMPAPERWHLDGLLKLGHTVK